QGSTFAQMSATSGGCGTGTGYPAVDSLSTPSVLYIHCDNGPLWKTSDGGLTWTKGTSAQSTVSALYVDPLHARTLYAGTPTGGIFKTTDGGTSWQFQIGFGDAPQGSAAVRAFAADPADATRLFATV